MTYGPPPNHNWQQPPQPPPPGPGYGPPPPGYGPQVPPPPGYQPGYHGPQFAPRKPAPRWLVIVLGILVVLFGLFMLDGPNTAERWVLLVLVVASGALILFRLRLGAILGAISFFLFAGLVAVGAFTPPRFYNPLSAPKVTATSLHADSDFGALVFGGIALVLMIFCLLAPILRALRPVRQPPSGPPPGYGWQPR